MCQWTRWNIECCHDFLVLPAEPCRDAQDRRISRGDPNYLCRAPNECHQEEVPVGTVCRKCLKTHTRLTRGPRFSVSTLLSQYHSSAPLPPVHSEQFWRPQSGLGILASAASLRQPQELQPQASTAQLSPTQQATMLPGYRPILPRPK